MSFISYIKCPFCNQQCFYDPSEVLIKRTRCKNHKYPVEILTAPDGKIYVITLFSSSKYVIDIYYDCSIVKKHINLVDTSNYFAIKFKFDKNITPENIDEKIKTYLIFQ